MTSNHSPLSHIDTDDLLSELLERYGNRQIILIAIEPNGMCKVRDMHAGGDSIPPRIVLEKVLGMFETEAGGE